MTRRMMTTLAAAGLAAGFTAACATQSAADRAEAQTEAGDAVLADYQATGETRSCVSLRSIDEIDPLDATRWLVTMRNGDAYLNEVGSGCRNAASDFTYLQYSTPSGRLCSNEIVRVLDRGTDTVSGSCGLGQFQALEPADPDA